MLAVLAEPAPARHLRIQKGPGADALRPPAASTREAPGAAPRAARPARRLPLDLGPVKTVFERRDLERRPSALRGAPDTTVLNVALLRVDFAADRKGDLTTGDGRMMRENPDPDGIFIDPAPHDEAYFQSHLTAVHRYWSSMSYGRIAILGDVFPRNQEFGAYTLSDMADYGPENENEFFSLEGLTRFFQDCLRGADADSAIVWDDYDVLFIVHAGSDWQNDVVGNSPFDLPTFSITLSDSDVVVADTGDTLTTGIVFPETSSQDGFLVALNGVIAHETGHQLGLFDIYNVETFAPTVSYYDLMDSGNLASVLIEGPTGQLKEVIGVLPTSPGAWSRWLVLFRFGMDPPLLKEDVSRVRLRAIQSRVDESLLPANTYKWARLPISDAEYFLLENRADDLDGRDAEGFFNTALDQDDSTGVVLGPIDATTDEISHNYDLLLDPGLVIWHVDERQVLANFAQGRGINVFYDKRGVTIEEADGIVDIGSPFSEFFLGTDKETFHADNNANFSPTTRPSSDSNLKSPSNISVLNIGPRDTTMVMDVSFSSKPRGWPMRVAPYGAAGAASVVSAPVNGGEEAEIVALGDSTLSVFQFDDRDGDGEVDVVGNWPAPQTGSRLRGLPLVAPAVGAFRTGETAIVAVTDSGGIYCWDGNGDPFANADENGLLFDLAPTRCAWPAIPADLDGDGLDELYFATEDGFFHGFRMSGAGPQQIFPPRPLPNTPPDSAETFLPALAFGDLDGDELLDGIVAFVDEDSVHVHVFDVSGRRSLRRALPLPASSGARRAFVSLADFDRNPENNNLEVLVATDRGAVFSLDRQGDPLPGWPIALPPDIGGPAAFGDVDGDGLLEAVIASAGHRLDVLNYNATPVPGWPRFAALADHPGGGAGPVPGPAVADVDGDGRQDVLCGFADFTIRAFDGGGREIAGFPLVTGAAVRSTPAVVDANGDGRLELFAASTDGFVYARTLAGFASETNPAWGMVGAGPKLHGSFDERRLPERGADSGSLVRGPVTIYPNPAFSNHESIAIRYTLGGDLAEASEVEISLYNLAGELVERIPGTTFANTENVARVSTKRLASGAYFCTLRARSGERESSLLEKFAVVR